MAAVSLAGNGVYQLVATPATKGPGRWSSSPYGAQTGWQATQTIGSVPVKANRGLSVSAGDLSDDGMPDIVVGSQANGRVAVYSEELGRWVWSISPLGKKAKDVRVAVDSSEGASGSIVVTGGRGGRSRRRSSPGKGAPRKFQLPSSPGSGALVPLGAGYVYRPSTIVTSPPTADDSSSFDYSPGPATPVVLFAATGGSELVIQDFEPASTQWLVGRAVRSQHAQDTFVEPLWGSLGKGFIPMQVTSDPDATGQSATTNPSDPPIDLVVLPKNDYVSPFSIDLSGVPASVTAGLEPITPLIFSTTNPWGPAAVDQHASGGQQPDHGALPAGAGHRRLRELPGRRLPAPPQSALAAHPARSLECHRDARLPEPGSRLHQLHGRRLRRRAGHRDVRRHHDAKRNRRRATPS